MRLFLCFETGSHYVDQVGLELEIYQSASQVLGLNTRITILTYCYYNFKVIYYECVCAQNMFFLVADG